MADIQVLWVAGATPDEMENFSWEELYENAGRGAGAVRGVAGAATGVAGAAGTSSGTQTGAAEKPWLMLNMVQSLDGGVTSDDVSGDLSSDGDFEIFMKLRSLADVVLVGAETVRKEDYSPSKLRPEYQAQREARGQQPLFRMAVVSASLNLDPQSKLFGGASREGDHRPLIYAPAVSGKSPEGFEEKLAALNEIAEVVQIEDSTEEIAASHHTDLAPAEQEPDARIPGNIASGDYAYAASGVNLSAVCDDLHRRGHKVVLCEGGPSLNSQLVSAGLINELCLSLSPTLLGGDPLTLLKAAPPLNQKLRLLSVCTDGSLLFLRYGFGQ